MTDYSALDDAALNRLCAERCGWKKHPFVSDALHPDGVPVSPSGQTGVPLPDYCRDRNALPELWEHVAKRNCWGAYIGPITRFVRPDLADVHLPLSAIDILTASPRQHVVAFLMATEGER